MSDEPKRFEFHVPPGTSDAAVAALKNIMERVARGELKVEGMEPDPHLGEAIRAGNALSPENDAISYTVATFRRVAELTHEADAKPVGDDELEVLREINRAAAKVPSLRELGDAATTTAHPAPWRWVEDADADLEDPEDDKPLVLVDANGERLISVDDQSDLAPFVAVASPRVQALTEAAAQLEGVLARLVKRYDDDPEASGYQDLIDEASALLTQIKERSK